MVHEDEKYPSILISFCDKGRKFWWEQGEKPLADNVVYIYL